MPRYIHTLPRKGQTACFSPALRKDIIDGLTYPTSKNNILASWPINHLFALRNDVFLSLKTSFLWTGG